MSRPLSPGLPGVRETLASGLRRLLAGRVRLARLPAQGSIRDLVETRDSRHAIGFGWRGATGTDATARGDPRGPASNGTPMAAPGWTQRWRQRPVRTTRIEQRSLFGEILDWMFAPLLLLWPLSVAVTFVVARSLADAPFDRALEARTEALSQQVRIAADRVMVFLPRASRDLLAADEQDSIHFQVMGTGQRLLAGEADLPQPRLYDFPMPGKVSLRTANYQGTQVRIGYLHIDVTDGEVSERVLVQVAETLDKRGRLANEIIKGVIFPQFVILPLAVMLVWFGLGRGLWPLKTLQQRIRDRRPDDLSPIDPKAAPEEIAPLVDAFNDLLERLDHSVAVQKRFIADAAHQLKTPLAGLRTQAEVALRESDPTELRRILAQIARSSQRAGHLVNQLLSLARMENLGSVEPPEPIDLLTLTRDAVADWVPVALERGLDLGFEPPGPGMGGRPPSADMVIAGQALLLRELLNNLIDNALRYTPRGGTVTVRIGNHGHGVRLEVEDNGPGIPETERSLVFGRFYRVLGTGVDGSGLGLPIVREIAEQHRATVTIEDAHPGQRPPGARFTVTFPAAAAGPGRAPQQADVHRL